MTDARKVRPVAPLDAERAEGDGWNVRFPRAGSRRATPSVVYLWWSDAEFAAHFIPAELYDAVLTAARGLIDEFIAIGSARFVPLIEAIDAYDARRQTDPNKPATST